MAFHHYNNFIDFNLYNYEKLIYMNEFDTFAYFWRHNFHLQFPMRRPHSPASKQLNGANEKKKCEP